MEKSVQITLIIVAGVLLSAIILTSSFSGYTNTINADGYSEIEVMPDLVSVYFSVETQGATSKIAEDANSEISGKLETELLNRGFEKEEIQTVSFSIYPNYNWVGGKQNLNGYIAYHSIKIELDASESDKLGNIIDAATNSGALISSIDFELSQEKQNEYKAKALELAAEDAKIKAEATAKGLGKKVGRLVSVSASSFDYYPWNVYAESAGTKSLDEATASIQPSEQTISASVSAVFKIR